MSEAMRKSITDDYGDQKGLKKLAGAAFDIASDLEDDVVAASDFASALAMIAETIDEEDGRVVARLAWAIRDCCKEIEAKRCNLFDLTHPYWKQQFEGAGRPSDSGEGHDRSVRAA